MNGIPLLCHLLSSSEQGIYTIYNRPACWFLYDCNFDGNPHPKFASIEAYIFKTYLAEKTEEETFFLFGILRVVVCKSK